MENISETKKLYEDLKNKLVARLGTEVAAEFDNAILAIVLRAWGSDRLSEVSSYKDIINEIFDSDYTGDQVYTAAACCADKEREFEIPDFLIISMALDNRLDENFTAGYMDDFGALIVKILSEAGEYTKTQAGEIDAIMTKMFGYIKSKGKTIPIVKAYEEFKTSEKIREAAQETQNTSNDTLEYVKNQNSGLKETELDKNIKNNKIFQNNDGAGDKNSSGEDGSDGSFTIPITLRFNLSSDSDEKGINAENIINHVQSKESDTEPDAKVTKDKEDRSMEELLEELDGLVGLDSVKTDVHSLINFIKVTKMREDRGMTVPTISYHLVFTGNPGTGKTTVARLVAQLYYKMGILAEGQLVETDRSALVAGYLGQTAIKTQKVIQQAMGGVLFIDEAYSLANDDRDSYGREAIETILKAMEDHRDELVVIVAGYTDLMHKFIDSNPGLSSRFNKYFQFPDYTGEELKLIFERFCRQNGYVLDADTKDFITEKFTEMYKGRDENFGNARTVRNVFEKAINVQANRIAGKAEITDEDLAGITAEDIRNAMQEI